MSTIRIPASELHEDDEIEIAGNDFPITSPWLGPMGRIIAYQMHGGEQVGAVEFPPDMLLTVTRPDPDAELIEVMARAMGDRIESNWRSERFNEHSPRAQRLMRDDARAALAAAREAGLL